MLTYGKTAANAVASMSYLAEIYHDKPGAASALVIAKARDISRPLVAKLLTILSTAGLVSGMPGPGGGYRLNHVPSKISLYDIVTLFEKMDDTPRCPFGPQWCGNGDPCPMHDYFVAQNDRFYAYMKKTKLSVFK